MFKSQPTDNQVDVLHGGSNHITGTAEPKVVKFFAQ